MNFKILIPICFLILTVNNTIAQDKGAGIAAAIGGIAAIGAGIAAVDQLEESLEQKAVEHILETYPEIGAIKFIPKESVDNETRQRLVGITDDIREEFKEQENRTDAEETAVSEEETDSKEP